MSEAAFVLYVALVAAGILAALGLLAYGAGYLLTRLLLLAWNGFNRRR